MADDPRLEAVADVLSRWSRIPYPAKLAERVLAAADAAAPRLAELEETRREIEARKRPCCDEHGGGICECPYWGPPHERRMPSPNCPQHGAQAHDRLTLLYRERDQAAEAAKAMAGNLGYLLAQYERVVNALGRIEMDTPEDQEVHGRAVTTFDAAAEPSRALLDRARALDEEADPTACSAAVSRHDDEKADQ